MFGIGTLGRRLVEGLTGLFALLGFLYVPLGQRTGFEHARAVLSTPAASAAVDDVARSALQLRAKLLHFVTGHGSASPTSEPKPTARGDEDAARRARNGEPRPVPPKLK